MENLDGLMARSQGGWRPPGRLHPGCTSRPKGLTGVGVGAGHEILDGSLGHQLSSSGASIWAEVDQPVSGLHQV